MTRILCPVDLKEASLNAINYAGHLAKKMNGELTLLHVIYEERPPTVEESRGIVEDLEVKEREITDKLEQVCKETREYFGITCNYKISSTVLDVEIEKEANSGNFDLIVMGTEGVTSISEYYFGSNASQVMEICDLPIITVPLEYSPTEIKHIVYASDYKNADELCLQEVWNLAKMTGAKVTVLHVSKKKEQFGEEVFEAITNQIRRKFEFEHQADLKFDRVVYDDVEMGLRNYLYEHQVDLVTVLTQHRNVFQNMFHESLSKELILLAEYPIMTFHKNS